MSNDKEQELLKKELVKLLQLPENKLCADCGAKGILLFTFSKLSFLYYYNQYLK